MEVCGCQPRRYQFTLDFSRTTCYEMDLHAKGTALSNVVCHFDYENEFPKHDFTVIRRVIIREYNPKGDWLNNPNYLGHPLQDPIRTPLYNGESFIYTSVMSDTWTRGNVASPNQIPAKMEIELIGDNQQNQATVFSFTLYFSNDCQTYPVVVPGDYVGPVTVVRISIIYLVVSSSCVCVCEP